MPFLSKLEVFGVGTVGLVFSCQVYGMVSSPIYFFSSDVRGKQESINSMHQKAIRLYIHKSMD